MVKIILNTDLGCDVDDVGAVALLNTFSNLKETTVLGITHCTSNKYAVYCTEIINDYYNNNFRLGVYNGEEFLEKDNYAEKVSEKFYKGPMSDWKYQDSLELLVKTLYDATDNSITLVNIGQLNIFNKLLEFKPSSIIPVSGYELLKKKVKECIIMGGYFNKPEKPIIFEGAEYITEYNIVTDIPSSKNFIENSPCKITFIDFYLGLCIKTMQPLLIEDNENNPITYAYKVYGKGARESWDLLTIYYAVRCLDNIFTQSELGNVIVTKIGETKFISDPNGRHRYLKFKQKPEVIKQMLDTLILNNLPERNLT